MLTKNFILNILLSFATFTIINVNAKLAFVYPNTSNCNNNVSAELCCIDNTFYILKNGGFYQLYPQDLDSSLRKMNAKIFSKFLENGGYVQINKNKNNYKVTSHLRLRGGGVGGATAGFWTGKFAVHLAFHGSVAVVAGAASIIGTPAAGIAVAAALESTFGGPVEVASNIVGTASAIAAGTATGPV